MTTSVATVSILAFSLSIAPLPHQLCHCLLLLTPSPSLARQPLLARQSTSSSYSSYTNSPARCKHHTTHQTPSNRRLTHKYLAQQISRAIPLTLQPTLSPSYYSTYSTTTVTLHHGISQADGEQDDGNGARRHGRDGAAGGRGTSSRGGAVRVVRVGLGLPPQRRARRARSV